MMKPCYNRMPDMSSRSIVVEVLMYMSQNGLAENKLCQKHIQCILHLPVQIISLCITPASPSVIFL